MDVRTRPGNARSQPTRRASCAALNFGRDTNARSREWQQEQAARGDAQQLCNTAVGGREGEERRWQRMVADGSRCPVSVGRSAPRAPRGDAGRSKSHGPSSQQSALFLSFPIFFAPMRVSDHCHSCKQASKQARPDRTTTCRISKRRSSSRSTDWWSS